MQYQPEPPLLQFQKIKFKNFINLFNKIIRTAKKFIMKLKLLNMKKNLKKPGILSKWPETKNLVDLPTLIVYSLRALYFMIHLQWPTSLMSFLLASPKIVNKIIPVYPLNIPPLARNFFYNSETERDILLFSFSNSHQTAEVIIEATNSLQPKLSQDMCGLCLNFIQFFLYIFSQTCYLMSSRYLFSLAMCLPN